MMKTNDKIKNGRPHLSELVCALKEAFSGWVGTPSEDLLSEPGIAKDHLSDKHGREWVDQWTMEQWDAAWDLFDAQTGRREDG